MAWFASVPVIDVHRDNIESLWPSIILAIRNASFIALDAEFSGLGLRKNLMLRSFDDRYAALREVAKSHSILSLGVSCFKSIEHDDDTAAVDTSQQQRGLRYQVQTFNITMLCDEDYVVEPVALRFLVEHSFDFNKQYSQGVSYYRGQDKPGDKSLHSPRLIFNELILSEAPIILHNGLIDMAFLYQNLYGEMPPKSSQFISDMSEMFRGGVLDTKYVADFEARMVASYLEYVFRKCQRSNARLEHEGKQHVAISFLSYPKDATFVENHPCELPRNLIDGPATPPDNVCQQYAAHGHCGVGIKCPQSHNPDTILDEEEVKIVARKKKRNHKKRERRRRCKRGGASASQGDGDDADDDDGGDGDGEPPAKMQCEEDGREEEDQACHGDGEMGDVNGVGGPQNTNDGVRTTIGMVAGGDMVVGCRDGDDSVAETDGIEKSDGIVERVNGTAEEVVSKTDDSNGGTTKDDLLLKPQYAGCHRAGIDAFMTGFAMATFISKYGHLPAANDASSNRIADEEGESMEGDDCPGSKAAPFVERYGLTELVNKLYLGGKDVPLQITKSHFAKTSASHREKLKRIMTL